MLSDKWQKKFWAGHLMLPTCPGPGMMSLGPPQLPGTAGPEGKVPDWVPGACWHPFRQAAPRSTCAGHRWAPELQYVQARAGGRRDVPRPEGGVTCLVQLGHSVPPAEHTDCTVSGNIHAQELCLAPARGGEGRCEHMPCCIMHCDSVTCWRVMAWAGCSGRTVLGELLPFCRKTPEGPAWPVSDCAGQKIPGPHSFTGACHAA